MRYLKVLFVIFSGCLFKLPSNYTLSTNEDASKSQVTSHLPGVNKGPLPPPIIKTPIPPLQHVYLPQDNQASADRQLGQTASTDVPVTQVPVVSNSSAQVSKTDATQVPAADDLIKETNSSNTAGVGVQTASVESTLNEADSTDPPAKIVEHPGQEVADEKSHLNADVAPTASARQPRQPASTDVPVAQGSLVSDSSTQVPTVADLSTTQVPADDDLSSENISSTPDVSGQTNSVQSISNETASTGPPKPIDTPAQEEIAGKIPSIDLPPIVDAPAKEDSGKMPPTDANVASAAGRPDQPASTDVPVAQVNLNAAQVPATVSNSSAEASKTDNLNSTQFSTGDDLIKGTNSNTADVGVQTDPLQSTLNEAVSTTPPTPIVQHPAHGEVASKIPPIDANVVPTARPRDKVTSTDVPVFRQPDQPAFTDVPVPQGTLLSDSSTQVPMAANLNAAQVPAAGDFTSENISNAADVGVQTEPLQATFTEESTGPPPPTPIVDVPAEEEVAVDIPPLDSSPIVDAPGLSHEMHAHEVSSELDALGQIDEFRSKPHEMYNGVNPHVDNDKSTPDAFKVGEMVPSKPGDPDITTSTMTHMLSSHTIFDVLNNFYATHAIVCTLIIACLWIAMMTIQLLMTRARREEELNSQLAEAHGIIHKLKVDRNAFGEREKRYKNDNYNLEMDKNNLLRKLDDAEAKVAELVAASQREQVNCKVVAKLENELAQGKVQLDELNKSLDDSKSDNSKLKQEISKLKNEKQDLVNRVDKISAEKDLLSVEVAQVKTEVAHLKMLVDKKEDELTKLDDEIANKEEEFRNREEELLDEQEQLKKELASLKEQLKGEAAKIGELKLELDEKVKRYDALKEVMKEIEQLTDSKDGINLQKVLDISQLQVEVATLKEKSSSLEEQVELLQDENESLRDKLTAKEAEVKEVSKTVNSALEAEQQAKSELAYFQKYFAKRESEMTTRMAEIEAQRLNKEDLTGLLHSQNSKLLADKETLEKEYQKLRSEFSDFESRSKKQIMKMDHDLNKQWTEWRKAVDDANELRQTVKYLKQQLAEVTKASSSSDVPDYGSDSGSLSGSGLDLPPPPPLPPELIMSFISAGGSLPSLPGVPGALASGQPPPPPPFLMSPPQMPPVSMSGGLMDDLPPPPPPPMGMASFLPAMVSPMVPLATGSNSSSRPPSIALGHNESFPGLSNYSDHGGDHYSHPGGSGTPPNMYHQQLNYHQSPPV